MDNKSEGFVVAGRAGVMLQDRNVQIYSLMGAYLQMRFTARNFGLGFVMFSDRMEGSRARVGEPCTGGGVLTCDLISMFL